MIPKAKLILNMLDEMWSCDGWIDPLEPLLDGWAPEQAAKPYAGGVVSVEGNINHTAFWEEFALHMVAGTSVEPLGDLDAATAGKYADWMPTYPECSSHFKCVHADLRAAIASSTDSGLAEKGVGDSMTRAARAYTRAIHSGYHAGQLSYLRRLFGAAEPRAADAEYEHAPVVEGAREMLLRMVDFAWSSGYSIDPFADVAKDLSKEDATRSVKQGMPTILGIVNHMSFWEEYVTRRLRGHDTADMAIVEPGEAPEGMPGWPEAGQALIAQHGLLRAALEDLSDAELAEPRPGKGKRFEEGKPAQWLVYGIVIHHAYHIGQIVLLRQLMGHREFFV